MKGNFRLCSECGNRMGRHRKLHRRKEYCIWCFAQLGLHPKFKINKPPASVLLAAQGRRGA